MAADLSREPDLKLKMVKGGLGELSVDLDGSRVFEGNRLWYPTPSGVIKKVRTALQK